MSRQDFWDLLACALALPIVVLYTAGWTVANRSLVRHVHNKYKQGWAESIMIAMASEVMGAVAEEARK